MTPAHLTDTEIAGICEPLVQPAAQVRFLRRLGLPVERRPNGRPLVSRAAWERRMSGAEQVAAVGRGGPKWRKAEK
jgi:hypothetical protein